MGLVIDRSSFAEREYHDAGVRLRENLAAIKALLDRPGFGVADEERLQLPGVIRDRLDSNTTPAAWQRRTFKRIAVASRPEALRQLVEEYLVMVATNRPISDW